MKFQLVSDIHTEFHGDNGLLWANTVPRLANTLVVAGDLGTPEILPPVLRILCGRFDHVVFVNGNHDVWGSSFKASAQLRQQMNAELPNLHWLNNQTVTIEGQRFIGTTMWFRDHPTNFMYEGMLKDFRKIAAFRSNVYEENKRAVNWLKATMTDQDVVVTHHLPTDLAVSAEFKAHPANRFYVCAMEATISVKKPKIWACGHSHSSADVMLDQTRILRNPYGYDGMAVNAEFDMNFVVEV